MPDDTSIDEANGLMQALRRAELPYTFVIVPVGCKAMAADEVRNLLDSLAAVV